MKSMRKVGDHCFDCFVGQESRTVEESFRGLEF